MCTMTSPKSSSTHPESPRPPSPVVQDDPRQLQPLHHVVPQRPRLPARPRRHNHEVVGENRLTPYVKQHYVLRLQVGGDVYHPVSNFRRIQGETSQGPFPHYRFRRPLRQRNPIPTFAHHSRSSPFPLYPQPVIPAPLLVIPANAGIHLLPPKGYAWLQPPKFA